MPFLGSTPADKYQSLAKQTITGDGSTAYTLNRSVTNAYDMEVFINNVRQEPDTSYTASGNTITFTAAVTSGDSCYLIYQGQSVGSINPPANSVGGSQIANNTITTAHLHTGLSVPDSNIAAMASSKLTGALPALDGSALTGTGKVLQVVQGLGTALTVASTTPTTVVQASITVSQGSKVFATACGDMNPSVAGDWHYYRIHRDSTAISQRYIAQTSDASFNLPFSISFVETSGLSAGTYTYSLRVSQGSGSITYGETGNVQAPTIVLMEIAQ